MEQMEVSIVRLQEELKKAYENIVYLNKGLEMERELYVNVRELLKSTDRKLTRLKEAYEMQIDLVEALEDRIAERDELIENLKNKIEQIEQLYNNQLPSLIPESDLKTESNMPRVALQ